VFGKVNDVPDIPEGSAELRAIQRDEREIDLSLRDVVVPQTIDVLKGNRKRCIVQPLVVA
jgi:hypothetical protein